MDTKNINAKCYKEQYNYTTTSISQSYNSLLSSAKLVSIDLDEKVCF